MEIDQPEASTSTGPLTRASTTYDSLEPLSSTFKIQKSSGSGPSNGAFRNQYASVYYNRLMALKNIVRNTAEKRWSSVVSQQASQKQKSQRVLDIRQGTLSYVIGTIYMEMRLKPNILEELAREQFIAAPPPRTKVLSDDDEIMLEDESGRVRLVGQIMEDRKYPLVTGVIAAVLGAENASGDFEVVDICFAGMPPQPSSSTKATNGKAKEVDSQAEAEEAIEKDDDTFIAFVSGLELGTNEQASGHKVGLLAEWLLGEVGGPKERSRASRVSRLVLAGNSMCQPIKTGSTDAPITTEKDKKPRKTYGYDTSNYSNAPTAQLDNFLSEILPSIDVDIMCGAKDPAGTTLPQQPLHESLLPNASSFDGFNLTTNPTWFEAGNKSFLGTSGQNIDDIFRYLESDDRLSMACSTLEWAHMAPTSPDTLFCYPFHDRDPFILTRTPDVYFIGNQPTFETRLVKSEKEDNVKSRVVLLPTFAQTGEIVLLNLRNLQCTVVQFQ